MSSSQVSGSKKYKIFNATDEGWIRFIHDTSRILILLYLRHFSWLHVSSCWFFPMQSPPLASTTDFIRVWVRVPPPHVLLQADHDPQGPQVQSTELLISWSSISKLLLRNSINYTLGRIGLILTSAFSIIATCRFFGWSDTIKATTWSFYGFCSCATLCSGATTSYTACRILGPITPWTIYWRL